jgi:hypothetical protein
MSLSWFLFVRLVYTVHYVLSSETKVSEENLKVDVQRLFLMMELVKFSGRGGSMRRDSGSS